MKSTRLDKVRFAGWLKNSVRAGIVVLAAYGLTACSTGLNEAVKVNNPTPTTSNLKPAGPAALFYVDFVNGKSALPNVPVIIGPDSKEVVISGWAADHKAKKPAGGVVLVVDGKDERPADYGSARPDVAAFLKDSNYNAVGYSITLPATVLPKGNHSISFKVISADRQEYFEPDRKVELIMQ
jgi:hypothetical protein